MSAHSVGAACWVHSERARAKQRRAELARERNDKEMREAFLQMLAERLACEANISLSLARQRVQRLSITASSRHRSISQLRDGC
jgi:hypothetical protein